MTSEPKTLAAQSFEACQSARKEWIRLMTAAGLLISAESTWQAAWQVQQAKIDELEKKLALAREGIMEIEESAKHNMSTQGVWIRGKCVNALAAIDGETKG